MSRCGKRVGLVRAIVLLDAFFKPVERDVAFVEWHADRGSGARHSKLACPAKPRRKFLVLDCGRDGICPGGDFGVDAERPKRHLHRIVLAVFELPVRRLEFETQALTGADESDHDIVFQSAIDGAAVDPEHRLDFPRPDSVGLALLSCDSEGGKEREGGERGCRQSETAAAP